jgi:hypothetical protein
MINIGTASELRREEEALSFVVKTALRVVGKGKVVPVLN